MGTSPSSPRVDDLVARLINGTAVGTEGHEAVAALKRRVMGVAPDLADRELDDDVVQRTIEILLRGGRYVAGPGSLNYLDRTIQTAARDVRSESGPPGPSRPWRDDRGEIVWARSTRSLHDPVEGADPDTVLGDTLPDVSDAFGDVVSAMVAVQVIEMSGPVGPALAAMVERDLLLQEAAAVAGMSRFALDRGLRKLANNDDVRAVLLAA